MKTAERVQACIAQLKSPDMEARSNAASELRELGPA